jgi:hypothetical protein
MTAPQLDGRWFAPAADPAAPDLPGGMGEAATIFRYGEEDGEVWATYVGGPIRRGYLVGSRQGNDLTGHFVQLDGSGRSSAGRYSAVVSVLPDGRLRLAESWSPDLGAGAGDATTTVAEEITES